MIEPRGGDRLKGTDPFSTRQNVLLRRKGLVNATPASRRAELTDEQESSEKGFSSTFSHGPSVHPSVRSGYAVSIACAESTIGAGDNTKYWDYQHRSAEIRDLGHSCRECRGPFSRLGEPITERRGARTSMRYHANCFSGFADPRSQANSSMHVGNLAGTQMAAAPIDKAGNKMRTVSHFKSLRIKNSGTITEDMKRSKPIEIKSAESRS